MVSVDEIEQLRHANLLLLNKLKNGQLKMKQLLGNPLENKLRSVTTELNGLSLHKSLNKHFPGKDNICIHVPETSSKVGREKLQGTLKEPIAVGSDSEQGDSEESLNGSYLSGGRSSIKTRTSTPKVKPNPTPVRSILKKRKIIHDNVKVDSKFNHSDLFGPTPNKGLNYSYSKTDDDDLKQRLGRVTTATPTKLTFDLDESYINDNQQDARANIKQKVKNLITSPGNDRQKAGIVRELTKRPVSVLFSPRQDLTNSQRTVDVETSKPSSRLAFMSSKLSSSFQGPRQDRPLLGYDWIAGLLDNNDPSVMEQTEEFFDDIKEFRKVYKEECINRTLYDEPIDLPKPIYPEVKDPEHKCIHTYTLNNRLFTKPVNQSSDGRSYCPVCTSKSEEPTADSPRFVRVSIPRSTLASPYRVKPHRRNSFDPTDTCALSEHCLAGWQSACPSMVPAANNTDLRGHSSDWETQHSTTLTEAQREANTFSRSQRMTRGLLNTSHALRFELQKMEKLYGQPKDNPANTTSYPLL